MVSEGFSDKAFTVAFELLKYSVYDDDEPPVEGLVSGFSGLGAPEVAAKRLGVKPVLSMDGWDESIRTLQANNPGSRHEQVWFGDEASGGSMEDVLGMIHDETSDLESWALHMSPPCDDLSRANQKAQVDATEGMKMIDFTGQMFDTVRDWENAPSMMSMEQTPEARKYILDDKLGLNQNLSEQFKAMVRNSPDLEAAQFGAPTFRNRLWSVEGTQAMPTHTKDQYRAVTDLLPNLTQEWEESAPVAGKFGRTQGRIGEIEHLRQLGKVGQGAYDMLSKPTLSMGGSINPGKRGSPWNDKKQGYAWKHVHDIDRPVPSITHHRPALTQTRYLSRPEALQIQGFTPEEANNFKFPQKDNATWAVTPNKKQNIIDTQIGNTLSPNIYENLLRNVGRGQQKLW